MNEKEFSSHSFKGRYGIDDLQTIYAWHGNSQGDTSATNNTKEGQASEGWMSFVFSRIDQNDQEAINNESKRREKANEEYIKQLKKEGKYGKEYVTTIHVKHNPIFDTPSVPTGESMFENHKLVFVDKGKLVDKDGNEIRNNKS